VWAGASRKAIFYQFMHAEIEALPTDGWGYT
jgi:hypothetical protein